MLMKHSNSPMSREAHKECTMLKTKQLSGNRFKRKPNFYTQQGGQPISSIPWILCVVLGLIHPTERVWAVTGQWLFGDHLWTDTSRVQWWASTETSSKLECSQTTQWTFRCHLSFVWFGGGGWEGEWWWVCWGAQSIFVFVLTFSYCSLLYVKCLRTWLIITHAVLNQAIRNNTVANLNVWSLECFGMRTKDQNLAPKQNAFMSPLLIIIYFLAS